MVVFGPWAFGTTQPWAIHCMNGAAYVAGLLLLLKVCLRRIKGYHPPRWEHFSPRSGTLSRREPTAVRFLKKILAGLTVAVLVECLLSAWNAAAWYQPETRVFHYQRHFDWLPHSFDAARTWTVFWKYLGLAAAFWSMTDWLAGLNPAEERNLTGHSTQTTVIPARLRILLWVLAINGALLGIEGIFQRECGTDKLLFLLEPRINTGCISQFASYAYRSNAAQYFNLLWPVCLGFWWVLHHSCDGRTKMHHWLLPCTAVMAACPFIASTRGGALVSAGMLLVATGYLGLTRAKSPPASHLDLPRNASRPQPTGENPPRTNYSSPAGASKTVATLPSGLASNRPLAAFTPARSKNRESACLLAAFVIATLGLGWYFGWATLAPRMELIGGGFQDRAVLHDSAEPMARDYPLYGTGPGTFATVFQLYRYSDNVYWSEQVYDDWLETRITFGWLGFGLLLAALGLTVARGFLPGGVRPRQLVFCSWVALGGCLVHARFDIPFQIHSTLFLFLLICAMLLNLGRGTALSRA